LLRSHARSSQDFSRNLGLKRQLLVALEFDSGSWHFPVRQHPDERFVVKIDNLNPVASRVVNGFVIDTDRGG
jgi:hypothetical protein